MCLILFAYDYHPRYSLVVAANRDEFYNRPAMAAAFWADHPEILAGRDLYKEGTWMGITTGGRFAGLTNYRNPAAYKSKAPSRGQLVKDYLTGTLDPETYIKNLDQGGIVYNEFNLLLGTYDSLYYYSNRAMLIHKVEKGLHGLSNSMLDVPWPKVSRGINVLGDILQYENININDLFAMMADRTQPDDQSLPQTGVGLELERMLAPSFVTSSNYGTRVTTIILVDRNHHIKFWERSFPSMRPDIWNDVYYEIKGQ